MRLNATEQKIMDIAAPIAGELALRVLWVEYKQDILEIFAENITTGQLTLDECTKLSRELSPILEVEDPISGAYRLNVSSPGIDRPLFNADDFNRYSDLEVKLELEIPLDGQKKFRGFIVKADETHITLKTDKGLVDLPTANLYKAKLVMNDHLIKVTKERLTAQAENNTNPESESES